MRKPIIYSQVPELSAGDYDVFVASWKEDESPMYAVINRKTEVVEFTNENQQFIRDWLSHFVSSPEKDPNFDKLVGDAMLAKKAN